MHNDNKPDTNPLLGDGDVNEEQDGGEFGGARTTFVKSKGLSSAQADALMLQYGRNELEEKKTPKWYIFLSQLWQPMVSQRCPCLEFCFLHKSLSFAVQKSTPKLLCLVLT